MSAVHEICCTSLPAMQLSTLAYNNFNTPYNLQSCHKATKCCKNCRDRKLCRKCLQKHSQTKLREAEENTCEIQELLPSLNATARSFEESRKRLSEYTSESKRQDTKSTLSEGETALIDIILESFSSDGVRTEMKKCEEFAKDTKEKVERLKNSRCDGQIDWEVAAILDKAQIHEATLNGEMEELKRRNAATQKLLELARKLSNRPRDLAVSEQLPSNPLMHLLSLRGLVLLPSLLIIPLLYFIPNFSHVFMQLVSNILLPLAHSVFEILLVLFLCICNLFLFPLMFFLWGISREFSLLISRVPTDSIWLTFFMLVVCAFSFVVRASQNRGVRARTEEIVQGPLLIIWVPYPVFINGRRFRR